LVIGGAWPLVVGNQVSPKGLLFGSPLSRNDTVVVRPLLVKVVEAPLVINEYQALESVATVRRGSAMVNSLKKMWLKNYSCCVLK